MGDNDSAAKPPHIFYKYERMVIGTYGEPEDLSPAMFVALEAILEAIGESPLPRAPEGEE